MHWRKDSTIFPTCWILIGQFKFQAHQSYVKYTSLKYFPALGTGYVSLIRLLIGPRNVFTVTIGSCLSDRLSSTRCTSTSLDSTWFSTNQRKEAPEQISMKWTRITCAPSSLLKRSSWPSQLIRTTWYVLHNECVLFGQHTNSHSSYSCIFLFHFTRILFHIKTVCLVMLMTIMHLLYIDIVLEKFEVHHWRSYNLTL